MKNFKNREVRVFISSTFRGMNNDRKVLVDHVFPEIRRRCAERGIGFTEVDLRWEITNEEVDKAVKLILGFINALNNDDRDPNYAETVAETDSENRTKQANLKQRLRDYACDIELYNQPDDLKSLLIEPLWEKITNKFHDTLTAEQKLNLVIWHFCGSSADSTNPIELLRRIMLNLKSHFNNQLQETEITRGWWHSIPAKNRLFISTISAEDLLAHPQTANPLYLLIFGELDKLEQHLEGYLQAETIPALYDKVLARLEADYQPSDFPHLVADTLSLLWASRQGLNEAELLEILDIPQAIWSPLYLALQDALVSRGGLLSFFHDYLKQAVENRYLSSPEDQQQWHLRLADYFDEQELDSRVANELPWQLQHAGEKKRLRSCISDIPMCLQIVQQNKYELLSYWQNIGDYEDMENAYILKLVIANWKDKFYRIARFLYLSKREPVVTGNVLLEINNIFLTAGCYSFFTLRLNRVFLKTNQKNKGNEHPDTATCMNNLANLYYAKGDYDNAEPLYQRALEILEKVLGAEHPNTVTIRDNLEDCRAEMD